MFYFGLNRSNKIMLKFKFTQVKFVAIEIKILQQIFILFFF